MYRQAEGSDERPELSEFEKKPGFSEFEKRLNQYPVVTVPIRSLHSPDSPRLNGENDAHARALAESDAQLPPIIVHRETMRVIDGAHRLRAAALRGEDEIEVRFFEGTEDDAFVLAVEANVAHGLPLSLSDRRAAAARIIASHPQWSDRAIASATGLAAKTVGGIRRRATDEVPQLHTRVGRDGRARPVNTAAGRRRVSTLIQANPTASLRQIAAKAGVSQGTARDVRDRLARGEDPVPLRQRGSTGPADRYGTAGSREEHQLVSIAGSAPDPMSLLARLKQDPSLRFTETGRTLIRLLDIHSLGEQERNRLVDSAPAHCRGIVRELARACAEMWQELALRFDQDIRGEA